MRAPIGNRRPTIRVDVFAWYHVGLPSVYLRSRVYVRAHSMCRRRASVPGARSSERAAHTRKAPYIRSIYTRPIYTSNVVQAAPVDPAERDGVEA